MREHESEREREEEERENDKIKCERREGGRIGEIESQIERKGHEESRR